ncbi:MAG: 50S ribosomal protein L11 [Candidatus Aenigmarchaeota archaeon]|nr:50S ribosomal protein L11 [Candidatus Aenigmarchaeota archaeon]
MGRQETLDLLVDGGKAAPGPTTAPKLSMYKLNIGQIFKEINDKTKDYAGMSVPVKLKIDTETKSYEISVGTPPVSSVIKKELGIELAKITDEEKAKGKTSVGDLKFEQIVKIAKIKKDSMLAKDLKTAVKQVVGTANSMTGVMIEGKRPKELIKDIDEGKFDTLFK